MARYKAGDRVKVRDDLEPDTRYYMYDRSTSNYAIKEMRMLGGSYVTICSIGPSGQYTIVEHPCYWTDEMFVDISVSISNEALIDFL